MNNSNLRSLYDKDGFIVIKNFFECSEIDAVYDEICRITNLYVVANGICNDFSNKTLEDIFILIKEFDEKSYAEFLANLWRLHSVNKLLAGDKIESLLRVEFAFEALMATGGHVVHVVSDQLKFNDGYFGLPAHQDFPSTQGSLDGVVLWVPLQDITTDKFPVTAIKGKHKEGLLDSTVNSNQTWELVDYDSEPEERLVCEKGDLVVFSVFTPHKTGSGSGFRIAMSTRYDNAGSYEYARRNYFCGYGRTVKRKTLGDLDHKTKATLHKAFGSLQ